LLACQSVSIVGPGHFTLPEMDFLTEYITSSLKFWHQTGVAKQNSVLCEQCHSSNGINNRFPGGCVLMDTGTWGNLFQEAMMHA
jgi:hypothetical protein